MNSAELEYEYIAPNGQNGGRHLWTAVGPLGGIHIWAEPTTALPNYTPREKYYGGVEVHSLKELYEYTNGVPDHAECWLLHKPCWHTGSSLQFSERIEPLLSEIGEPFPPHTHEYMNAILYDWYRSYFSSEDDDAQSAA